MSRVNDNIPTKLALERSANDDALKTGNATVTSSTPDDATASKDATPPIDEYAGPWTGWAELENDPVLLQILPNSNLANGQPRLSSLPCCGNGECRASK